LTPRRILKVTHSTGPRSKSDVYNYLVVIKISTRFYLNLLFVFVSEQHNSYSYEWIFVKFRKKVDYGAEREHNVVMG